MVHRAFVLFTSFVAIPMAFGGCSTLRLEKYAEEPAVQFSDIVHAHGLTLSAKALASPDELKRYFGIDLWAADVVPIRISIRNDTQAQSYIIPAEKVLLGSTTPETGQLAAPRAIGESSERIAIAGLVLLSPLIALMSAKPGSDSLVIQENLEASRFRTATIDPGRFVSGFAYFNVKGLEATTPVRLCLSGVDGNTLREVRICKPIDIRRKE